MSFLIPGCRSARTLCSGRMVVRGFVALAALGGALVLADAASAQTIGGAMSYAPASEADEGQSAGAGPDDASALPERLRRTIIAYDGREAPGSVIIDTGQTYLYYVLGGGRAIRYGVGVGRQGFTWSGTETISRKAEWPDWIPPAEMIARQPYLPRFVAGGPSNPLGARAMYLGNSSYRIHGTNDPSSIGKFVSSGCIRMTNEDVVDLFSRVQVGAKVVVLPKRAIETAGRAEMTAHAAPAVLATMRSADDRRTPAGGPSGIY